MSEQEQPVGEFVVYSTDDGELDEGGTCKDYLQVRQVWCCRSIKS